MGIRESLEEARRGDPCPEDEDPKIRRAEMWAGLRETLSKLNFIGRISRWFKKNVTNFKSNLDGH